MTTKVPKLMTTDNVAECLGLTRRGVWQLVQDRKIPFIRLSGGQRGPVRFVPQDVLDWLQKSRVPSQEV